MFTKTYIDRPIFVIGNPRSGTSLLRLMLTNHPEICIAPECGFLQWWYDRYFNWGLNDSRNEDKVDEFIKNFSQSRKIETWNISYQKLRNRIIEEQPRSYAELVSLPYLEYADSKQSKTPLYWGDKNNYYIDHLDLIQNLYPYATYIFIVRDGRDVACSYKMLNQVDSISKYKPDLPHEISKIAIEWRENNNTIIEFSRRLGLNKYFIRYEDLVTHSEDELQNICALLDLPFSSNMLDYHLTNREMNVEPRETMAWKGKTMEKPDSRNIGKFKTVLSYEESSIFKDIAEDVLDHYNYL